MNTTTDHATTALPHDTATRDWLTILLVGLVHATSHFFQLVIPALYIALHAEFGWSYAQMGLLTAVFFVTSAIGQASAGFVVDRVGARPIMWFGLASFVVAALLMAAAGGFAVLMLAAIIAGLGNAVFHPVDLAILNQRVHQRRLGHAFSVHGLSGNLGYALAPVFIITLTDLYHWRAALLGAAGLGALALTLTVLGRHLLAGQEPLRDAAPAASEAPTAPVSSAPAGVLATLALLASRPALWVAFLFFACTSLAMSSVQNYTIPLLGSLYGIAEMHASSALSSYMVAAAFGMMAGGFLVSATPHTERVVAVSLLLSGACLAVLAVAAMPVALAVPVVIVAGFCSGLSGPSRDMLVRRVAPKGATGSVYGLVYSGIDVGVALGPLAFGVMLDAGLHQGPWLGGAAAFALGAWLFNVENLTPLRKIRIILPFTSFFLLFPLRAHTP